MSLFGELFEQDENIANKLWGVTTGIVLENWNEEQKGKVKVEMNLGTKGKNVSGWIPVMTPYGGKTYGMYALPEIGSQVVVAFEMGDRDRPMVLGSLWNNKNTIPEETAVEDNHVKRMRTKGGCELLFEEEESKEKIAIRTPGELTILLDDENKTITVKDKEQENGIEINTESGEMVVSAKTKVEFKLDGTSMLTLDGSAKKCAIKCDTIELQASQTLKMKGQTSNLLGASISVKADSNLSLESSTMASLKGSMVKIN